MGGIAPLGSNERQLLEAVYGPFSEAAVALEVVFSDGTVRLAATPQPIAFDGRTFLGLGGPDTIEAGETASGITPMSMTLTICSLRRVVSELAEHEYHGSRATMWALLLNQKRELLTNRPPLVMFRGRVDFMEISVRGAGQHINLSLLNALSYAARPAPRDKGY